MQYCPGVGHDVEFFTCRSSRKIETQLFPTSEFRAGFGRICRRDRARDESAGVLRPGIPVPVSRDAASGFLSFRGGGPFCRGGAPLSAGGSLSSISGSEERGQSGLPVGFRFPLSMWHRSECLRYSASGALPDGYGNLIR